MSSTSMFTRKTRSCRTCSIGSHGPATPARLPGPQPWRQCPEGAGVAMTVIGTNKLLNQVFQNTPPVELRIMNLQKLNAMGVNPHFADMFLNNTMFSPREQTLFVHALGEMNGVSDRGAMVRLSLSSQNPTIALFRQRQAQMYAGYNKSVAPLQSFISLGGLLPRAAPPTGRWFSICRLTTWSGPSPWRSSLPARTSW